MGTLNSQKQIWTTVWGGEPGFTHPLRSSIIGVSSIVDASCDPVIETLFERDGQLKGEEEHQAHEVAALTIDLATRSRVKLAGKVLAGEITRRDDDNQKMAPIGEMQLAVKIDSSLGNCPKYLNKKDIVPVLPEPKLLTDTLPLPERALGVLAKSDLFFLTSSTKGRHLSTNHRGGPPGFVRVLTNMPDKLELVYPEYSGNRMYQTLGNLQLDPAIGLVFPDFETGDALYVSGTAEILVGDDAANAIPSTNLAVKVSASAVRLVEKGLPFRGRVIDHSPYNPPVRYLATEKAPIGKKSTATVQMIAKKLLTPRIARFRFRIHDPTGAVATWTAGQYAAFSFADELKQGYSHMRDDDPRSLNDDYIRTFTVSSPPKSLPDSEFEVTVRNVGTVTDFMFRQHPKAGLTVPFLGFAGDFVVAPPNEDETVPFVAGGIGITSVLGELEHADVKRLRLFWMIHIDDIALVTDSFQRNPGLARSTRLFVSGTAKMSQKQVAALQRVEAEALSVATRRITADDLMEKGLGNKYYMCVSPVLRTQLIQWLPGKQYIYEDFGY